MWRDGQLLGQIFLAILAIILPFVGLCFLVWAFLRFKRMLGPPDLSAEGVWLFLGSGFVFAALVGISNGIMKYLYPEKK